MKKFNKFLAIICMVCVCVSLNTSVFAQAKVRPRLKQSNKLVCSEMVKRAKNTIQKELDHHSQEKNFLMTRGGMTPLTKVFIYSIVSDQSYQEHGNVNNGAEYFNPNTLGKATVYDHGGTTYICTYEIGYSDSYSRKPMYKGTKAKLLKDIPYDPNKDSFAEGLIQIWQLDNVDSGTFTYEAKSAVSPYYTQNDWLVIK